MKRKVIAIIAILMVGTLLVAACAAPPPPEKPTETGHIGTLLIGMIYDLTGPTAAANSIQFDANTDIFAWINKQGGLAYNDPKTGKEERVMLEWDYGDNKGVAGPCPAIYERIMAKNPIMWDIGSSAATIALSEWVVADKIPLVAISSIRPLMFPPPVNPYVFGMSCDQPAHAAFAAEWALKDWRAKGHTDKPTFAWFTWDGGWGRACIAPEVEAYIQNTGFNWGGTWLIPGAPTDTSTELLDMVAKGVDYTYGHLSPAQTSVFAKDWDRLKLKDKVQIIGSMIITSDAAIAMTGPAINGLIAADTVPLEIDVANPGVQKIGEVAKHFGKKLEMNYMFGFATGLEAVGGIKLALATKGWPITSTDIKEALESGKEIDVWGLTVIKCSPKDHTGAKTASMRGCKDQKIFRLTEWSMVPTILPK